MSTDIIQSVVAEIISVQFVWEGVVRCIIVLLHNTTHLQNCIQYSIQYIYLNWVLQGERLFIFSTIWQRIGRADRISSMDEACLSQCSWSIIEKVVTATEIGFRKFRGMDMENTVLWLFHISLRSESGIGYSAGKIISKVDAVQLFLHIQDINEKGHNRLWTGEAENDFFIIFSWALKLLEYSWISASEMNCLWVCIALIYYSGLFFFRWHNEDRHERCGGTMSHVRSDLTWSCLTPTCVRASFVETLFTPKGESITLPEGQRSGSATEQQSYC